MVKKGQASIEFLVFFALLITLAIYIVWNGIFSLFYINQEKAREDFEGLCQRISNELLLASSIGNGYERNFTLPKVIDGYNFTITVSNYSVYITWDHTETYCPCVAERVEGSFILGQNTIKNVNGVIHVNE